MRGRKKKEEESEEEEEQLEIEGEEKVYNPIEKLTVHYI